MASPASLEELLASLGISNYLPKFQENDVDLDALRLLTEPELTELGLSLGHRKKLLAALHGKPVLPAAGAAAAPTISAPVSSPKPAPPPPAPSKGAALAPPAPPPAASRLSSGSTAPPAPIRATGAPAPPPPPASPKPATSSAAPSPARSAFPSAPNERPTRLRNVHPDLIDAIQGEEVDRVREMIAALDPVLREEVQAGCFQGNLKIMEMLLEHGGERFLLTVDPKNERTLIHDAAQNGNTKVCKLLVELGVDPKQEDCDGRTAPQYAVEYEWPDTVKYFASIGALPAAAAPPAAPSKPAATAKIPTPPAVKPPPGAKAPPLPPPAAVTTAPKRTLPVQSVKRLTSVVPTERVSVASYLPPALKAEDFQERKFFIEIQRKPKPPTLLAPLYQLWEPWQSQDDITTMIARDKPDIGFALTEKQLALLKRSLIALGIKESDLVVKASKDVRKLLYAISVAYLPLAYVLLTELPFDGIDLAEPIKWEETSFSRPVPFTLLAWNNSAKLTQSFTIPCLKLIMEYGFDLETRCCTYGHDEHTLYDLAEYMAEYPEIAAYFKSSFSHLPTTGMAKKYLAGNFVGSDSSYTPSSSSSSSYSSSSSSSSSAPRKITCPDCRGAGSVKCTGCKNGYWGPKNQNVHGGCKGTARSKCGRCRGSGECRA